MWPEGIFFLSFPSLPSFSASVLKGFKPSSSLNLLQTDGKCWVLKHNLRGTDSCRHLTEMAQPLCGIAQELQPLTKLSSIQNCPVICLSDLSYNGRKRDPVSGTSEELGLVFLVVSHLWIQNILRYRFWLAFWALVVSNPICIYFLS